MLAIKVFGMIATGVSSFFIGVFFAKKEEYRINDLEQMKNALNILKSEIEYSLTPLPEAMESISLKSKGSFKIFFNNLADKLYERRSEGIDIIWREQLQHLLKNTKMEKEDIERFENIGVCLGNMDRKLQNNNIISAINYINEKNLELKKISEKNKKMYYSLGTLGGALIVLLFI